MMLRTLAKAALLLFYAIILLAVSAKLFFEPQFDAAVSGLVGLFRSEQESTLTIGIPEPLISLSPLANDTGSRARLLHIYEPLVAPTKDLSLEPRLALSYGSLNDLTWEFRLRPDVRFHSGKTLTIEDVLYSLDQAKNNPLSGVKDLAASIAKVEKISDEIFQIHTAAPDPLLPSKLSFLLIFPDGSLEAGEPVPGTGPFMLDHSLEFGNDLVLNRFETYWGQKPEFLSITLKTFRSKEEKAVALRDSSVDILAGVPPDTARNFDFPGFKLQNRPSLEANFLMFHFDKVFRETKLREAVRLALDPAELAKLTQGFSEPLYQFVGDGIFGFHPELKGLEVDLKKAESLVKEVSNFSRVSVSLDLPTGLDIFGESVTQQLKRIGIDVSVNFLSPQELSTKIVQRKAEFYFFGWKNDLGDAGDFFSAVVHSPTGNYGQFNGGNYRNSEVDRLIESSQKTLTAQDRLQELRDVMRKITSEDFIGIPLFSPELLYAVSEDVEWEPRVDGLVLAQEVKM